MNKKEVLSNLKQLNLIPSKHLGQNFLINKATRDFIIEQADIKHDDIILEIGPGLGALTEQLVKKAKKVYAVEIDSRLFTFLENKFAENENIEIINRDILNFNVPYHNKVISNLPYKITGPILEKVFFKENPPQGILTIEKSIAERLFIQNNYKNRSRITMSVNSYMKPIKKFPILRSSFYPTPRIDLSLIIIFPKITIDPFLIHNETKLFYLKFLGAIMPYKNKNLINALELYLQKKMNLNLNKSDIKTILDSQNIKNDKVFTYENEDLLRISKLLYQKINIENK